MSDFFEIHWMMQRMGIMTPDLVCKYSEADLRVLLGQTPERFDIDLLWMIGAFAVSNLNFQKNEQLETIRNAKPTDNFDVPERLRTTFHLLEACGYAAKQTTGYTWSEKASVIMCSQGNWHFFLPEGRSARSYVERMIETCPDQLLALFRPTKDSWWPATDPQHNGHAHAVWCVSNHWYGHEWHLAGIFDDEDRKRLSYGFSVATDLAEFINAVLRAEIES